MLPINSLLPWLLSSLQQKILSSLSVVTCLFFIQNEEALHDTSFCIIKCYNIILKNVTLYKVLFVQMYSSAAITYGKLRLSVQVTQGYGSSLNVVINQQWTKAK